MRVRGWSVLGASLVASPGLQQVENDQSLEYPQAAWVLRGVRSHERYTERPEHDRLVAIQSGLGRPSTTAAVLIPICKSEAWWAL